jgi:hypothetical protein
LLSALIQVNIFPSNTLSINSIVVTLMFVYALAFCYVYLVLYYFAHFLTVGDQISIVYHRISSLVCNMVGSGFFLAFPGTHC